MRDAPQISGAHKAQLFDDTIHVVLASITVLAVATLVGVGEMGAAIGAPVFTAAIGFAAGRSGALRRSTTEPE